MNKVDLMLDSGAFSAWMKQIEIDIDEYAKFCLENNQYIDYIINLDVIPGKFGQKGVSGSEVETSARKGFENYYYLLDKGVPKNKLIHVFHQNESFDWLVKMVDEMDYIGLSPANDRSTSEKALWLDRCMDYVIDSDDGLPLVKFHGFAVTSLKLMLRYPWYSVDSTSWVLTGRFGSVFVPIRRYGKYIYDENSWKVTVSTKSPGVVQQGKHINTFSDMEREQITEYFEFKGYKLGKTEYFLADSKKYKPNKENGECWFDKKVDSNGMREVERVIEPGLSNDYKQRDELNIIYFLDLEKSMPEWPWPFELKKQKGFGMARL